jgi:hypothetical protein
MKVMIAKRSLESDVNFPARRMPLPGLQQKEKEGRGVTLVLHFEILLHIASML